MPEMAALCGMRLTVERKIARVWELEVWVQVPAPVYVLRGAACTGMILSTDGPCDRRCHMLWHPDWLRVERLDRFWSACCSRSRANQPLMQWTAKRRLAAWRALREARQPVQRLALSRPREGQ